MMGLMELGQIERFAFHRGKPGLLLRIEHADRLGQFLLAQFVHFGEPFAVVPAALAVLADAVFTAPVFAAPFSPPWCRNSANFSAYSCRTAASCSCCRFVKPSSRTTSASWKACVLATWIAISCSRALLRTVENFRQFPRNFSFTLLEISANFDRISPEPVRTLFAR